MQEVADALEIVLKYRNQFDESYPENSVSVNGVIMLMLMVSPSVVSQDDIEQLEQLGFYASENPPLFFRKWYKE